MRRHKRSDHGGRWLALLLAWLVCLPAHAIFKPSVLYRIEPRDPLGDWVFQRGFQAPGHNTDLVAHVTGVSVENGSSGFVSATDHLPSAERIARARLEQGNAQVWIYEIRATEAFYEVNGSLRQAIRQLATRDGRRSPQMANLETVETLYGHQYEWVTPHPIPSRTIRSARAYRLEPAVSPGAVAAMVEVPHTYLLNPNYADMATQANGDPWPIALEQANTPREQMRSLTDAVGAVGLSWCAVGLGSGSPRAPRSLASLDVDCRSPRTPPAPFVAKVWDISLDAIVERPVPWRTEIHVLGSHKRIHPETCSIALGRILRELISVYCDDNDFYAHYVVLFKASGTFYHWVNTAFMSGRTGIEWQQSTQNIPVLNSRSTLGGYGYTMTDVFSMGSRNWSSEITVAPFYPDMTFHGRQKRATAVPLASAAFSPARFPAGAPSALDQLPMMRR